ncbi:MAG: hypothetical protein I8H71_13400 [Xanthomonadaceae bacterium]|nr:hypothetical protein [Xanthomonadaceae bacterium]
MFVIPALLIPLVFGLAVFRLYQIPRRLWLGQLRFPGRQRVVLQMATIAAYVGLLSYTIVLASLLTQALWFAQNRLSAFVELVVYMAAYPLVYLAAAWIFYYGFKPQP